jgi:ABC-2 type transport system ATP-binding protein
MHQANPAEGPVDAIVITGLSKSYVGRRMPGRPPAIVHALADLSVSVREAEIFGFLGPNGAGKSTTIRILLGFLHPTSGKSALLGLDAVEHGLALRGRVGYLPGGIALYDTMSGEDLLDYLARLYGRGAPLRDQLVERMELSRTDLKRLVRDYSRGMRQKMGIIQALQHDPELAILDEPTEGLDPLMQRAFYDILDERQQAGRTIFFSSHVLSEVERVCDRVAIIREGRLVALSRVETLLARRRRQVELCVEGDAPDLSAVAGVTDLHDLGDGRLTCRLEGDVGPFLTAIGGLRVHDLTIEPARLEDAFLEYYESDMDHESSTDHADPAATPLNAPGSAA